MNELSRNFTRGFMARLVLLSLLAVIGFDLFLHAGILASLYKDPGSFLLPSETAFKLIPLGYLAFGILNVMLVWLMLKVGVIGLAAGFEKRSLKKPGLVCLGIFLGGAVLAVLIQNLIESEKPGNCSTFMFKTDSALFVGHNLDETPGFHIPGRVCINKRNVYREGVEYNEFIADPDVYEKLAVPFEQRPDPKISWVSKYGSITFNSEGIDFPDGGINEKGLALFEMSMRATRNRYDEKNPTIFMVLWIQYVLDNFTTIDEVIESTYRINLQGWSWHYFVSDAGGDCAVIEFLEGEVVVHRGEDLRYPVLCNSSYSKELERLDDYGGFKDRLSDMLGKTPRFVRAARRLDEFDPSEDGSEREYAQALLEEIAIRGWNKWSILVDVMNMKVYFHTDRNRELRYFSLDGFDLDRKPAEMLDIHGNQSGDVTSDFQDYSYERNLELTGERAELLLGGRFKGLVDNGVTAKVYSERYAGYSKRIRDRQNEDMK